MTRNERKLLVTVRDELKDALKVIYSGRVDLGRRRAIAAADLLSRVLKDDETKATK